MQSNAAVMVCIAEAEKRIDAMQVLCEILTGQVKGERRQLEEIKSAIGSPSAHEERGQAASGEISAAMLE